MIATNVAKRKYDVDMIFVLQVYMPKFLTDTLYLKKNFIAIVPLVTYVSSFISAMLSKPISMCVRQEVSQCQFSDVCVEN